MAEILPFRALRPPAEIAQHLASPPYDVLSSDEARQLARGNAESFLHITKAEIDLPAGVDPHSPEVYQQAAENLHRFELNGLLREEEQACFYIYRLTMQGRSQTGLVCLSSIADYHADVIKKHELTRPEKEKDRIDHMLATGAHTGNVFLAYRDVRQVNEVIAAWQGSHPPVYDFSADDAVRHTIWLVDDAATIDRLQQHFRKGVPVTYIADGHHRAASAARVSDRLKENREAHYFLTTIFPASELKILDYNRVVKDLHGMPVKALLEKLRADFLVEESAAPVTPARLHEFGLYADHRWYRLTAKEGSYSTDPIGVLDVSILSQNVLEKWLGIKDQRTDNRIDFVGGIRGLAELEKRVDSGDMQAAFSLYPVSIEQLFNIADSGNVMPPKSTWFEPKLRDGLLTHLFQKS